jgi:ArsR family transcriptional regulator
MTQKAEACNVKKIAAVDVRDFEGMERILRVLANKTSLAILYAVYDNEEACACELEPALKLDQPPITNYLRKLYLAGILKKREQWRYTFYSVSDEYRDFVSKLRINSPPVVKTGK